MAQQLPPKDMFVKAHQFVKTVYRDVYPSVDPTAPQLSQAGKVVIISGASQGIGKAIALGFAKANAAGLVLLSRTASKLDAAKEEVLKINPSVKILTVPTDVSKKEDVAAVESAVKSEFGFASVLVNCAGMWNGTRITETDPDDWWRDFEVNLKGPFLLTKAFLSLLGTERPGNIINVSSFGSLLVHPGGSSYAIAKLALNRLTEYIAAENPNVIATALNPGSVTTDLLDAHPDLSVFAGDTPELTAGLTVYLAGRNVGYLNGRYVSVNWSVDELEARKDEIVEKDLLKFDLKGEFGAELFQ